MGCTTLAGVPSSSTDSVTGGSSWSGGRPGGNIGNSDGLPSLEEALKMPCPTGTAARCGWCSTGEDVEYVVRRADARPACPASFTSCSRRARDRSPPPPSQPCSSPPSPRGDGACHPSNYQDARYGAWVLAAKRPTGLSNVWK